MPLAVTRRRVQGRFYRHSSQGAPAIALRRDPVPANRWQSAQLTDALYLADSPETAWAEWYRYLAERGLPPEQQLPRDLWSFKVELQVADLSTPAKLQAAGLELPRPGRRDWPRFQQAGDTLFQAGYAGLLAPSAARPSGLVLCLFYHDSPPEGVQAEPPPLPVLHVPVPPRGMRT